MAKSDVTVLAENVLAMARAITAQGAPGRDAAGTTVESLTEAVMGVTAGLFEIARAIEAVAYAIETAAQSKEDHG